MNLNMPLDMWDSAANDIVQRCGTTIVSGAQDKGRALVTISGTDEQIDCASRTIDRAKISMDRWNIQLF